MSARDRTSLDGRVARVTGSGSSEGIGFAAARIMGARGASVAIASTDHDDREQSSEHQRRTVTAEASKRE